MKLKLNHKITLIFICLIAVVFLGTFLFLHGSLKELTYERIQMNLKRQTALARSFLEEQLAVSKSQKDFDSLADRVGEDLQLRVTVIDGDGTVLGDSGLSAQQIGEVENHLYRPEIQQAVRMGWGQSRRFSTTIQMDMLYMATAFEGPGRRGFIRLAIPLSEIMITSQRLRNILLASVFWAFVISGLFSFVASGIITRPIQEISSVAQNIAAGDYSKKIHFPPKDEVGDLAEAFNFMTDQIRSRIREMEIGKSRLEAVLLSMFEGVLVVDKGGTVLLMNQALRNLLNIEGNPIGRKILEVMRNIDVQNLIHRTLKLTQGVETREISILLPEEKNLMVHATPVNRDGEVDGLVLVFHDITDLRRLEKMRREFVANVSHELRTPMASIKGYAETLLEGALEDKDNARDFIEIIYQDSDRLAKLIEDILDLSKIESGKMNVVLRSCDLKPVIERVVAGLDKQIKQKLLLLQLEIPDTLPAVIADPDRVAQVLLNLIDNAIKYTPQDGTIKISVTEDADFIRIEVKDSGIGIPESDIPRLFERFYRVDKARSRDLGGTGLGLSIVKHIVQAHGGEVSVASTPKKGSTFSFTIPKV